MAITVSPSHQRVLLELARVDKELVAIRRERASAFAVDKVETKRVSNQKLRDSAVLAQLRLTEMKYEVDYAEKELKQITSREKFTEDLLTKTFSTNKELVELEHELRTIRRRKVEVTVKREKAQELFDASRDDLNHSGAMITHEESEIDLLTEETDNLREQLDKHYQQKVRERQEVIVDIDPVLIELYEEILAVSGVGASKLVDNRCGACNMELSVSDISTIRMTASDVLVRCPECSVILVRST